MKSLKMVTKNIFQNKITFVHKFSKWQRIETLQKKEKERKEFLIYKFRAGLELSNSLPSISTDLSKQQQQQHQQKQNKLI